jgi:hypothetical protein
MPDLHAIGRAALVEITSPESIGAASGQKDEGDGVVSVYFETNLSGYPGWHWTVSIANLDGQDPSVLETELTPADGALLSPDWVPWSDRLADYKAAQEALGEVVVDESDDDAEDDESDDSDDDELGSDVVHGGDVDGVDIDEVDTSDEDDDEDEPELDPDDEGEKTY